MSAWQIPPEQATCRFSVLFLFPRHGRWAFVPDFPARFRMMVNVLLLSSRQWTWKQQSLTDKDNSIRSAWAGGRLPDWVLRMDALDLWAGISGAWPPLLVCLWRAGVFISECLVRSPRFIVRGFLNPFYSRPRFSFTKCKVFSRWKLLRPTQSLSS